MFACMYVFVLMYVLTHVCVNVCIHACACAYTHTPEVVVDKHNVGSIQRDVRPSAECDANIGRDEGNGVIDAVPDLRFRV